MRTRSKQLQSEKPYSFKPDGSQGMESEWAQAVSLDIMDEAAEKSGAVSCQALKGLSHRKKFL